MPHIDKPEAENQDAAPAVIVAPAFVFVPTPYLFVHNETLPEGMQLTEAQGFAEVTIEGLAPMPLEQLSWGYLADETCAHMMLFAAARDRLVSQKITVDETFFHVLPSFFAAAPADGAAHWVFIWEAGHVAGIRYEAGQPVPSRIELERLTEETPVEAFAARDRLTKRLGPTAKTDTAHGLLSKPEGERGPRDAAKFFFTHHASAESEPTRIEVQPPLKPSSIWTADMRDNVFRVNEQKNRQGRRQCTVILQIAAGFALLLFVGQLLWAGGEIMLKRKSSTLKNNNDAATTVSMNQQLLLTIDKFTKEQLRPFEMLGLINSKRPPNIWFDTVKATGGDTIVATAITNDPSKITDFVESLKAMPGIADAKQSSTRSPSRNLTNFTLEVDFKLLPPIENFADVPPPRPVAPPPDPNLAAMPAGLDNSQLQYAGAQQQFPGGQPQFQQGVQFQNGQQFQGGQTIVLQGAQGTQVVQFDPNQVQGGQQFQGGQQQFQGQGFQGQGGQQQFQGGQQQFQGGQQQFQGGQQQFQGQQFQGGQQQFPQQPPGGQGAPQVIMTN